MLLNPPVEMVKFIEWSAKGARKKDLDLQTRPGGFHRSENIFLPNYFYRCIFSAAVRRPAKFTLFLQ